MRTIIKCSGLAFIGDPHLTSRRPGLRLDVDFEALVLKKLQFCIDQANLRNEAVLITGDLFDREKENSLTALKGILRLCNEAIHPIVILAGNHDLNSSDLGEAASALSVIEASGCAVVLHGEGLAPVQYEIDGKSIGLGFTIHEKSIPLAVDHSVRGEFDSLVWMTHHNLAFPGVTFPGCLQLKEIPGVDLLVNGHLHKTFPEVTLGQTRFVNPGNITRLSIDVRDHEPKMFCWAPRGSEYLAIPHLQASEIFDLTSLHAKSVEIEVVEEKQSAFVALLAAEDVLQSDASGDGSVLKQELDKIVEVQGSSEIAAAILRKLFNQSVEEHNL